MGQRECREGDKGWRDGGADQQPIADTHVDNIEDHNAHGDEKGEEENTSIVQLHAQPHKDLVHDDIVLYDADQSLALEHGESKDGAHGYDASEAQCAIAQFGDVRLEEVADDGVALAYGCHKAQHKEEEVHNASYEGIRRSVHLLVRVEVQLKRCQAHQRYIGERTQRLEYIVRLRHALQHLQNHIESKSGLPCPEFTLVQLARSSPTKCEIVVGSGQVGSYFSIVSVPGPEVVWTTGRLNKLISISVNI